MNDFNDFKSDSKNLKIILNISKKLKLNLTKFGKNERALISNQKNPIIYL